MSVDTSNYGSVGGSDVIPYLCCDQMNNSFIQPNEILNNLMSNDPQPAAIVLYSQLGQCCGLAGQNLNYQRILTMPERIAAAEVGNITTGAAGAARATITGNFTDDGQDQDGQQTGSNSAVAMSILYSITGLITLLFLIIIATGAIRAHRYPERYGPRNGAGGRPRQSRAKGLARAVLETLPIVKFGGDGQASGKPDPNIEIENTTTGPARDEPHNNSQRHLSTIPESPTEPRANPEVAGALGTGHNTPIASADKRARDGGAASPAHSSAASVHEEGLGCSICTEDFALGEDVRVLPCDHKYHPQCVDPWLVNVSGTCPLWYVHGSPSELDAHLANHVATSAASIFDPAKTNAAMMAETARMRRLWRRRSATQAIRRTPLAGDHGSSMSLDFGMRLLRSGLRRCDSSEPSSDMGPLRTATDGQNYLIV